VVGIACATGGDDPVCRHGARWWLRHRSQWPIAALTLGGVTYDQSQVERLLRQPHRGLVGHRLAHQLAVAKLNLANGADDDIGPAVAETDAWLVAHPLGVGGRHREPRHGERRQALRLIKDLHRWNHGGCPDGSALSGDSDDQIDRNGLTFDFAGPDREFSGDLGDYDGAAAAAEETTSLGALKAMYR